MVKILVFNWKRFFYWYFNHIVGNLALSRALGDFIFKRNADKRAEEQVVTGELEFLIV